MELGLTATVPLAAIQNFIDVLRLATTLVFVEAGATTHTTSNFNFGGLWMKATVAHLCNRVVLLATVDLLPANPESLTDESHEFLKVPVAIDDMLSTHLAVSID